MSVREAAVVALGDAVKFESDGRDFYLRAAEQAEEPAARAVFLALAEDEKDHVGRVREIYEELKDKPGWPDVSSMVTRRSGVLDAFEAASARLSGAASEHATVRQALATARDMEKKGLAFYRDRASRATCEAEAEFYRRLADEEQIHLTAVEGLLSALG
ncbi:MAG: ferritin family protein [Deferrisomatales bacterium]|nr:ferritin family protein [Deferrisomatales bacterium]